MNGYRLLETADNHIDDIYAYSLAMWGEQKANAYVRSLYSEFAAIAARRRPWRKLPAAFDVDGYFSRHERHFIYWRLIENEAIGIVAVLHERMQQLDRFRELIAPNG